MFERRWISMPIAVVLQLVGLAVVVCGGVPGLADDLPMRLSAGMTRPKLIHKVEPRYTEVAKRAGVQGNVIVEAVIDEKGRVTDVHILRGLPLGLDRNAVEAIQQWRFKPARRGGKPVKVYFTLTATFRIKR